MKYSEFHRFIKRSKSGWKYISAEGSHYIYEREWHQVPGTLPRGQRDWRRVKEKDYEGNGIELTHKRH